MAKKRGKPPVQRKRQANTHIRSSDEWKEWLGRLTEHVRATSEADTIDRGLVLLARETDFKEAPPKR